MNAQCSLAFVLMEDVRTQLVALNVNVIQALQRTVLELTVLVIIFHIALLFLILVVMNMWKIKLKHLANILLYSHVSEMRPPNYYNSLNCLFILTLY